MLLHVWCDAAAPFSLFSFFVANHGITLHLKSYWASNVFVLLAVGNRC